MIHFVTQYDTFCGVVWYILWRNMIRFVTQCGTFCGAIWYIFWRNVVHFVTQYDTFFDAVVHFVTQYDTFSGAMWYILWRNMVHFVAQCGTFLMFLRCATSLWTPHSSCLYCYQYLNLIFTLNSVTLERILCVTPYLETTSINYHLPCRQLLDCPCCILLGLLFGIAISPDSPFLTKWVKDRRMHCRRSNRATWPLWS